MLSGPGRPFRWPRPHNFRPSYFRQIPSAAKHNLVRIPRERSPPLGIGNGALAAPAFPGEDRS